MIVKGQLVDDRYEILKTIGEGGMANVYLAFDNILKRQVAIKVLRGDLATDEKFVRRFQREALSASSLSHHNIVQIYGVGEDDGDYYIVMEYVPGKNLKQLLKKREKLTVHEVVDIMLQITSAMGAAHDNLIIHRDLKPQNILIKDDGEIKITDFGIAMALNATQLTQTNSAMGSVHYFPPEQANGKGATLKSDVYSLGIMMYELLTGILPFRGDNAVEIALKHLKEPFPNIRDEYPEIPQSVENILKTATAKNPKNRYANANEMHDDLVTCLDKERLNEPVRKLKYNEGILEENAVITTGEDIDNSLVSQIKDETEEKKNKKIIILGIVFGVLLLGLIFTFLILPKLTEPKDITIPDVSNYTVAEAEKKLKDLGFEVNVDLKEEPSKEIEEGKVIDTSPSIGRTVKEGSEITLVVSSGSSKVTVEDYTGKNYIEIKTKLEMYGITVTVEEKEVSENKEYDEQEIIDQSVKVGEELTEDDKITLYIPKVLEKYPDIVKEGWSVEETEKWAKEKGITLKKEYQETNDYEEGTIIGQSRAKDTVITKGATLKITIAKKRVDTSSTDTKTDNNKESKTEDGTTEDTTTDTKTE
jgi:eukaryotic-like serine/threonine-protein kinase